VASDAAAQGDPEDVKVQVHMLKMDEHGGLDSASMAEMMQSMFGSQHAKKQDGEAREDDDEDATSKKNAALKEKLARTREAKEQVAKQLQTIRDSGVMEVEAKPVTPERLQESSLLFESFKQALGKKTRHEKSGVVKGEDPSDATLQVASMAEMMQSLLGGQQKKGKSQRSKTAGLQPARPKKSAFGGGAGYKATDDVTIEDGDIDEG